MEAIQKALIPAQNGIIAMTKSVASMETGPVKTAAIAILDDFKKSEEALRDRLFVLQVWRRYDYDTSNEMARMKAGEFEDPHLAKTLEKREKRMDREKRERERDKTRHQQQPKRSRGGAPHYGYPGGVPHYGYAAHYGYAGSYDNGQQPHGRGGYAQRGRGGHSQVKISKKPSAINTCHTCGGTDHFYKQCTVKK